MCAVCSQMCTQPPLYHSDTEKKLNMKILKGVLNGAWRWVDLWRFIQIKHIEPADSSLSLCYYHNRFNISEENVEVGQIICVWVCFFLHMNVSWRFMEICVADMKTALGVDPNIHITQEHRDHTAGHVSHTHTKKSECLLYCLSSLTPLHCSSTVRPNNHTLTHTHTHTP